MDADSTACARLWSMDNCTHIPSLSLCLLQEHLGLCVRKWMSLFWYRRSTSTSRPDLHLAAVHFLSCFNIISSRWQESVGRNIAGQVFFWYFKGRQPWCPWQLYPALCLSALRYHSKRLLSSLYRPCLWPEQFSRVLLLRLCPRILLYLMHLCSDQVMCLVVRLLLRNIHH